MCITVFDVYRWQTYLCHIAFKQRSFLKKVIDLEPLYPAILRMISKRCKTCFFTIHFVFLRKHGDSVIRHFFSSEYIFKLETYRSPLFMSLMPCVYVLFGVAVSGSTVSFTNILESVAEEVTLLQNQGVNKIIALGHAGYRTDQLVAAIDGVDIVVGGHTDTFLYTGRKSSKT